MFNYKENLGAEFSECFKGYIGTFMYYILRILFRCACNFVRDGLCAKSTKIKPPRLIIV